MICRHCNKEFQGKEIHEHHIHPRFMDNPKGNGMKIYLCEKCHNILHLIIPKIIWEYVDDKDTCLNAVIKYTLKYGGKYDKNTQTT